MIAEWRAVRTVVDARELTIAEIASQYGGSPATVYQRLVPRLQCFDFKSAA
jgi:DNA-binding MurR/RpiR family transcriptional regulator